MPVRGNRRSILWAALALVLVTALATYQITAGFYQARLAEMRDGLSYLGEAENFRDLLQVAEHIRDQAVGNPAPETLVQGAIAGMVDALDDRYSVYLPADQYRRLLDQNSGSFEGIGVVVELSEGLVTIVTPLPGTPGERVGLQPQDVILAVDGHSVTGMTLLEAVGLITGPQHTQVRLTIQRGSEQLEMMVEREHIELPTVDSIMLPANTGYLRLFFFNERTAQLTAQALDGLRAQGMEKLILDLRRNPGGLLEDALRVAEMLVPEGPILILEDQLGQRLTRYSYSQGLGMPLAVLIDEGSASAAEIVAGAVRDRAAGTLVGTSTYGKGSVQTIIALDTGAGRKLTSGHVLTPRGIALAGEGLEPALAVAASVPLGMERPNMPQDDQLRAAWKLLNE